jgi:hypothetical protein
VHLVQPVGDVDPTARVICSVESSRSGTMTVIMPTAWAARTPLPRKAQNSAQVVVVGHAPEAVLDPLEEPLDVIAGAIKIWTETRARRRATTRMAPSDSAAVAPQVSWELSVAEIRRALMVQGDITAVARVALTEGRPGLGHLAIQLFRPVKPMLAKTARDTADALARLGPMALEYKLDGARVQVHKLEREVRVFTRSLNDVTPAVPEIVEAVRDLPVRAIILDGEALAFRRNGMPEPFQVTMRRFGRKMDVERMRDSVPLRSFFFDCLYFEGKAIIDQPGEERECAPERERF